jgi:PhnB protein
MNQFKPAGYNSVSPYFIVAGAQKLIDMLVVVFDGKEERRYDMPDGTIMHVEVRIDDSIIMAGDASEKFPPNQLVMHVYVPDVHAVYNRAIAYGCEEVEPPSEREGDPDRRGTFKDFAGNMWSVGTMK